MFIAAWCKCMPKRLAHVTTRNAIRCWSAKPPRHTHTYPYIDVRNDTTQLEHEATTSRISAEQLFYLKTRGFSEEDAISAVVGGYCKDVLDVLPLEFAAEATKLLTLKLENSVG